MKKKATDIITKNRHKKEIKKDNQIDNQNETRVVDNFTPDLELKYQTAEIFNNNSQLSTTQEQLIISLNNNLNFYSIKDQQKETINSYRNDCIITSFIEYKNLTTNFFIIGYNNGTINAFTPKKEKVFEFKVSNKPILKLFLNNEELIIVLKKKVFFYDSIGQEIVKQWDINGQILYYPNLKYFIKSTNDNEIFIYDSNLKTITVIPGRDKIKSMQISKNTLIIQMQTNLFRFFDLKKLTFYSNEININGIESIYCKEEDIILCGKKVYWYKIREEADDDKQDQRSAEEKKLLETESKTTTEEKYENNTLKIIHHSKLDIQSKKALLLNDILFLIISNTKIIKIDEEKEKSTFLSFHSKEIECCKIIDDCVYTMSDDRLIQWVISTDEDDQDDITSYLHYKNSLKFKYITKGFLYIKDKLLLFNHEEIFTLNKKNLQTEEEFKIKDVNLLQGNDSYLVIVIGSEVQIFEHIKDENVILKDLKHIKTINEEQSVTYTTLSRRKYLGTALLNNKMNIYGLNDFNLKICLYGHSLPVRQFDFSRDEKLIISASSDKLIKIWGLEFGECRRSFYHDARNVQFIDKVDFLEEEQKENQSNSTSFNKNSAELKKDKNLTYKNTLFMAASNHLIYYKNNQKMKILKNKDLLLFDYDKNFLVASSKFQLNLYEFKRYELMEEESESDEETLQIENKKIFDEYERLIDDFSIKYEEDEKSYMNSLTDTIKKLESDLPTVIRTMDVYSIHIWIKMLLRSDLNENLKTKIFKLICDYHMEYVRENEECRNVWKERLKWVASLRAIIKENIAANQNIFD